MGCPAYEEAGVEAVSRRHINKRAARLATDLRWELVHAAGCVWRTRNDFTAPCATRDAIERGYTPGDYALDRQRLGVKPRLVSVPRSLRPTLGRYVGGQP